MDQPHQLPASQPVILNYATPVRNDLRVIASRQKGIMYCILGYLACIALNVIANAAESWPLMMVFAVFALGTMITGAVFVFMLAIALYGTGAGIAMGICALIPLFGLMSLLIVTGRASYVLRQNGVRVGLMGARMRDIPVAAQ